MLSQGSLQLHSSSITSVTLKYQVVLFCNVFSQMCQMFPFSYPSAYGLQCEISIQCYWLEDWPFIQSKTTFCIREGQFCLNSKTHFKSVGHFVLVLWGDYSPQSNTIHEVFLTTLSLHRNCQYTATLVNTMLYTQT